MNVSEKQQWHQISVVEIEKLLATSMELGLDDNEVQRLKELKAILGAENNTQLNPFVQEFTGNPSSDYMSVTPDNIAAFNKFLQTKASNI